jgi:hypothetical protein
MAHRVARLRGQDDVPVETVTIESIRWADRNKEEKK